MAKKNTNSTTSANARIQQLNKLIEEREAKDQKVGSQKRKLKLVTLVAHMYDMLSEEQLNKLTADDKAVYESLMTEYTGHPGTKVVVKLGDTLLSLFQQYSSVPKLIEKINKQCAANGWVLNQVTGVVEAKQ